MLCLVTVDLYLQPLGIQISWAVVELVPLSCWPDWRLLSTCVCVWGNHRLISVELTDNQCQKRSYLSEWLIKEKPVCIRNLLSMNTHFVLGPSHSQSNNLLLIGHSTSSHTPAFVYRRQDNELLRPNNRAACIALLLYRRAVIAFPHNGHSKNQLSTSFSVGQKPL